MHRSHILLLTVPALGLLLLRAHADARAIAPVHEAQDLSEYELLCYCEAPGPLPQNIVRMDNNGEILLACRAGETRGQLGRARIDHSESQIQLLKDWRLLQEDAGVLRTQVPVLPPPETLALRARMRKHAAVIASHIRGDLRALTAQLKAVGRDRNTFAVLFSYVLDGLVWEQLNQRGLVKERKLSVEEPLWSGVFWASYPPRSFTCGTNSERRGNKELFISWSRSSRQLMKPFLADWRSVSRMFEQLSSGGRVTDTGLRRLFAPYELFDQQGRFTGPVLKEVSGDPLYERSLAIAARVAEDVERRIDPARVSSELGLGNEQAALVIAYHELMWELLDNLERAGALRRPAFFAAPERARPADFGDLILIVEHAPR